MAWLQSLLWLGLLCQSSCFTNYITHIQNYVNLVSAYSQEGFSTVDFPPVNDVSRVMEVTVGIHLFAINGFDEVAGNIELVAALEMSWMDEMSLIQSINFKVSDRSEFLIPYDKIWTPKLVLVNAIGDASEVGDLSYICRYNMNSHVVTWKPRIVISGSCTPDVTFYPFDKQDCSFVYTPWGFYENEVKLISAYSEWNLDDYDLSGEWDISTTSSEAYSKNNASFIEFNFSFKRKPLYFAFNILLPVLVLCLLNATVFLLPAESGERVGFSVTCFLSFTVLLNMIMDIMPRSSNPISYLCFYLVVMMANSGAMTLVTILMMRVYHKPEKSKVPLWLQRTVTFINCGCAKLRCCVLLCRCLRRNFCQCKCSCHSSDKSLHDEELNEISVDENNMILEKTTIPKETPDDQGYGRKGCFPCYVRCVKHDKGSNSKCCCGCILAVRKGITSQQAKIEETSNSGIIDKIDKIEKRTITNFCSCFKKDTDRVEEVNLENTITTARDVKIVPDSKNTSCECWSGKLKDTNTRGVDIDTKIDNANNLSKCFVKRSCKNDSKARKDLAQKENQTCFSFLKRNTNIPATVPNIEQDVLPDVRQSSAEKDKLDQKETILQSWEEMKSNKGSTLKPLLQTVKSLEGHKHDGELITKSLKAVQTIDEKIGEELFHENKSGKSKPERVFNSHTSNHNSLRPSVKSLKLNKDLSVDKLTTVKILTKTKVDVASDSEINDDNNLEIERKTERESSTKRDWVNVNDNMPKMSNGETMITPLSGIVSRASKKSTGQSSENEDEIDSLAGLEEEVEWAEVGRILDTFFFLAFSAGEAFFTVVFLVPIFTNDSGETTGNNNS